MVLLNPIGTDVSSGQTRRYKSGDILSTPNALYVSKPSHGFSVLDALRHDGTDWVKAQADLDSTLADGVVISVIDDNNFVIADSGVFNVVHSLSLGEWYFLSDVSAGELVSIAPGEYVQPLVKAYDANTLRIFVSNGFLSSSGSSGSGGESSLSLVGQVELTSPSNVMQIAGLNLNTDKVYFVYYGISYAGSGGNVTFVTFNDDTDQTNYYKENISSSVSANDSALDNAIVVEDTYKRLGSANLLFAPGVTSIAHGFMSHNFGATSLFANIYKYPSLPNITKLALRSNPIQFNTGSYLKVYRHA